MSLLYTMLAVLLLAALGFAAWQLHLERTAEHHGETMTRIEGLRAEADRDRRPPVKGQHRQAEMTQQFPAVRDVPQHDGHRPFVPWDEAKAKKAAPDAQRAGEEES